jgi:hypothetical protein
MKRIFIICLFSAFGGILIGQKSSLLIENLPLTIFSPHDIFSHQQDYVKSKSLFLTLQEKTFSIPLAFGLDNKTVFGASYQVKQDGNELFYTKPKFFAMKYTGDEWGDLVFEKDKELNSMKTSGKFLVSILVDDNADLHIVEFSNGAFSKPERINAPVNTDFNEASGTFTPDGKKIYFSSNRDGGYGGYDIYESEYLGSGKWTYPRNLGPTVNSEYDEESPYLLNDGITLYFSANGYSSKNDFDIYETILGDDGFFSDPERLEAPINTDFDDLFYQISPDEKRAIYLSSGTQGLGVYELIFY